MQQTGLLDSATCIVVGAQQRQRLAPLCPPACQLVSLTTRPQQHVEQQPEEAGARDSIGSVHDILRHVVTSQTADGTSFVVAYALKQQRALALAERGFFPMLPTDGLCFLPLDLSRDLRPQLQGLLHAVLHKVCLLILRATVRYTDEVEGSMGMSHKTLIHMLVPSRRRMSWPWGLMGSPTSRLPLSSSSAFKPASRTWRSLIRLTACKRCGFCS